jgi:hypothetical protein
MNTRVIELATVESEYDAGAETTCRELRVKRLQRSRCMFAGGYVDVYLIHGICIWKFSVLAGR